MLDAQLSQDYAWKYGDKTYSLTKGVQGLMRYMSFKDLGYNPISAIVNAFSNRLNAFMIGAEGKYHYWFRIPEECNYEIKRIITENVRRYM